MRIITPEITDHLHPPRLAWTKRLAKVLLILVIALVAARFLWGYLAARQLRRALNELASRGESTSIEQIQDPTVPDDQNAAIVWMQAIDAVDPTHDVPLASNFTYNDYPPYSPKFDRLLESGVAANTKSLALARQARAMSRIQWNRGGLTGKSSNGSSYLNMARGLANVLGDSALHAQIHGDDAEAIERINDNWALARAVAHDPTLVGELVAIGIEALTLDRASIVNSNLQQVIDALPAGAARPFTGPASRIQIVDLIHMLLAASDDPSGMRHAMMCEQLSGVSELREQGQKYLLLRPQYDADAARYVRRMSDVIRASNELTLPATFQVLDASKDGSDRLPNALAIPPLYRGTAYDAPRLSRTEVPLFPSLYSRRLFQTDFRVRMEMKLVATELAAKLYWIDHHRWPASIDALVPKYLPEIPADPFSTHRKIGYLLIKSGLPDGEDRPVVYDLAEAHDMPVDATMAPAVPTFSWEMRSYQFRDVTMWPPSSKTQPATAP